MWTTAPRAAWAGLEHPACGAAVRTINVFLRGESYAHPTVRSK